MTDLYDRVKKFVVDSSKGTKYEKNIDHFLRTAHWIKELKPDAGKALLIAAVSHDIGKPLRESSDREGESLEERIDRHQKRSAKVIGEFLEDQGAPKDLIDRVKKLVSNHERGGTEDQNVLKGADSVSFFETYVGRFIEEKTKSWGKKRVKEVLEWKFERISSQEARQICKDWYEEAVKKLEDK